MYSQGYPSIIGQPWLNFPEYVCKAYIMVPSIPVNSTLLLVNIIGNITLVCIIIRIA